MNLLLTFFALVAIAVIFDITRRAINQSDQKVRL